MRKLSTDELQRLSVDEFRKSKKLPVLIVLDNIRSGFNVGSVLRTGDAFGITAVYLCGITPFPPNREVMKTALGSSDSVIWNYFNDTKEALQKVKGDGYEIIMAEHTTQSIALDKFQPLKEKKYAIVFGNEIEGIQESLLPFANETIEIPQFGIKHSLNISVAAGIVLWDFWNKLRQQ